MGNAIHHDRLMDQFCWDTSGLLTELGKELMRAGDGCLGQIDDLDAVEAIVPTQVVWTAGLPVSVIVRVRYFGGEEVIRGTL
jgi:hypothetical protein